jgi:hypothetical protein
MPSLESQWEMAIEDWDRHDDDCKCPECFDGICINVGPIISTGHAHRSYQSGCSNDCQNCEYWVEDDT